MGIHNYIMPMNTGDFTHFTHYDVLPEYTKNTLSYIMTYTDHDRLLYNQYRSLLTTLFTFYVAVEVLGASRRDVCRVAGISAVCADDVSILQPVNMQLHVH